MSHFASIPTRIHDIHLLSLALNELDLKHEVADHNTLSLNGNGEAQLAQTKVSLRIPRESLGKGVAWSDIGFVRPAPEAEDQSLAIVGDESLWSSNSSKILHAYAMESVKATSAQLGFVLESPQIIDGKTVIHARQPITF